jgi:hypothetical protein
MNSIIPPIHSLLPNSAPHILNPISVGEERTLQVIWLPNVDAHGLFYFWGKGAAILAMHHNGYSCHSLAERLVAGDWDKIINQVNYIRNCGGMAIGEGFFERFKK